MSEREEAVREALQKLEELEKKYKDDPNWKKMPHLAFGLGDQAKRELDEKYGISYVKKRLEVEDTLGLNKNDSIQKKSD